MKGLYVTARIGQRYKRFLMGCYQSDTIPLERGSNLLNIIMPFLELTADEPEEADEETIKIELPLGNKKVYNVAGQTVYVCNTLWRNRLSEKGQYRVKRFIENEYRSKLRTYVDAYIEKNAAKAGNGKDKRVKEGITAFFIQYHITFTKNDLAAAARDWYRHRDKVDENKRSPLVC